MNLKEIVPEIARTVALLGPGPAAELRRGPTSGAGAAAYWRIVAEHSSIPDDNIMPRFVQAVAILTPRGNIGERGFFSAHNKSVPMGQALHSAEIPDLLLSRLLSAPKSQRPDFAVRISRRLAGTENARFNLITLANFLYSDGNKPSQIIAKEYYKAEYRKNQFSENETK
ncbi:MAG: hypothetical protein F4120_01975 [Rhodothermaceae bacterium]|nr:hypothetical protein [Rhodothermaceae bacterium]MXW31794.1 hypothetical protein [Rhodothermaceae bacterium]MYC05055.1 hypothetical protein [Rhodothermaceae bacterium]MYE62972.1 hypothetical protein [Rhodothermaceae bacterium]MYI16379.1 hypothetical protein [Rhodothermaceae bacterium]